MPNNNIRPDPEKLQYIVDCLSAEELLCQLAEEASELAQAALKYRRVLDGTNPTRISKEDAIKNLLEEIADVSLTIDLLEKFGYCAPGSDDDWYGKDMVLTKAQTQEAYRFMQQKDPYRFDEISAMIAKALVEGHDIVINADW